MSDSAPLGYRVATRQIHKARKVKIERMLPGPGEILAQKGQQVSENDVIGQVSFPGAFTIVNVEQALGLQKSDISPFLRKSEHDTLEEGEIIAETQGWLSFSKKVCRSPVKGKVAAIIGQWLMIETGSEEQVVKAGVAGQVVDIYPAQSVLIETMGSYIEAACGLGGEAQGILQPVSDDPKADIDENVVALTTQPVILLAGGTISEPAVRKAEKGRVAGVIVGSIDAALLAMSPPPQIPVIATEGFGNRLMAPETWAILQARLIKNNLTFIQASRVLTKRPVIFIPGAPANETVVEVAPTGKIVVGSLVRTLREPNAMTWGHVSAFQEQIIAGVAHRGAEVNFLDSAPLGYGSQFVPWLNLEQIG